MTRYVALLRGINVGGNRKVPMADLAGVVEGCDCASVKTYIQSGNVLLSSKCGAAELQKKLAAGIALQFGFDVPVVVRSLAQMDKVVKGNPFLLQGKPEKEVHVMFLHDMPAAAAVASLDPARGGGENAFAVVGGDIFLYMPDGIARTTLTNQYFDSRLKTVSTQRNWATVCKLHAMLQEPIA